MKKEDNNKRIERIVDELLAPTNMKGYKDILDKKISDEDNKFIDNWVKFIEYERKESEVESRLEEVMKKKEEEQIGILKFEDLESKVDITKYEYKPPHLTEEEQLEVDLLIGKIDIEDEVRLANAIIDKELLLDGLLGTLEETREIMVSEKIREVLLEKFHYFPVNVNDIAKFYDDNDITLEIPSEGIFLSRYSIFVKGKELKTFDLVLTINSTDDGVSLSYKFIEY